MKKLLVVFVILIAIIVGSLNFKRIVTFGSNMFQRWILEEFDKAEEMREKSMYGGEGKDTIILSSDGKFSIGKYSDHKAFVMHNEDKTITTLLDNVSKYEKKHGKIYVVSDEGVGIVDEKTNICSLLISKSKRYKITEDEGIVYLSSFEEFSSDDKAVLYG